METALKLRRLAFQFIQYDDFKNGETTFFWTYNLSGLGKLIDVSGSIGTRYLGVQRNTKVCEAANDEEQRISSHYHHRFHERIDHIHSLPYPKPYLGDNEVQALYSGDDY